MKACLSTLFKMGLGRSFMLERQKKKPSNDKAFIPELQKTNPACVTVNNNKAEALT